MVTQHRDSSFVTFRDAAEVVAHTCSDREQTTPGGSRQRSVGYAVEVGLQVLALQSFLVMLMDR
jgi:hypothetical protein